MDAAALLRIPLYFLLLAAGFLLPGHLLARCLRMPGTLTTGVVGSLVLLCNLLLLLDATGIPVRLSTLGSGVAAVSLALWLVARRRANPGASASGGFAPVPRLSREERWWLLPAAIGLGAVAFRVAVDPLSGFDHAFRWDHLARLLYARESLSFYPALRSADFTLYGWCDGIPPLVAVMNLWAYLAGGSLVPELTSPRVLLEALALYAAVWQLARRLGGQACGVRAAALLSCSALYVWSVAIGQETALTALGLVGMLVFLHDGAETGLRRHWVFAGLAAGLGALAREYGLAWTLLGLLVLARDGRLARGALPFLGAAVAVAAPWYLRNWVRTGNPLWADPVGGLFPTNPVHAGVMALIRDEYRLFGNPEMLGTCLVNLLPGAGALLLAGLAGLALGGRRMAAVAAGLALVVGLWLWSMPSTAGGWEYAKRVLTPALALAAVGGGAALARLRPAWSRAALAAACLLSAEAAVRSLYLPYRPNPAPAEYFNGAWRAFAHRIDLHDGFEVWTQLAQAVGREGLLVDHPGFQSVLLRRGARAHVYFDPALAFLFDERVGTAEAVRRLRGLGIRAVLLSRTNFLTERLCARHRFFRELRERVTPSAKLFGEEVYDLAGYPPEKRDGGR